MTSDTTLIKYAEFDSLALLIALLAAATLLVALAPHIVRQQLESVFLPISGFRIAQQTNANGLYYAARAMLLITVTLIFVITAEYGALIVWIEVTDKSRVTPSDLANAAFFINVLTVNLTMFTGFLAIWVWNGNQ